MKKQKFLAIRLEEGWHHQIKSEALKQKISIQKWIENLLIKEIYRLQDERGDY